MDWNFTFFFNSLLLGVGLAMDAFSVSMANGIRESKMSGGKMCAVAGVFSVFQGAMPLIGWVCIHTIVQFFSFFQEMIPWIALALLGYIGGKMLYEGIKSQSCPVVPAKLGIAALLVQGVATSIDALSVGFTIAEYDFPMALVSALIIAAVTFVICMAGLVIGKKAGSCLSGKAGIVGGAILIFIGLEIFITSWF
ncbi:MAG: manganese efflux pump [Ruminococcaceae bacterium]|nr:manganese efflux pump [Oscillospiraceae bacterium]